MLLAAMAFLPGDAQTLVLSQQKAADDFILHNGEYTVYFRRKDMLQALEEIEKKMQEQYDVLKQGIKDGTVKEADFTEKVPLYNNNIVRVLTTSLGCYLVLQKKVAVYKDNKPLKQIVIDEAPPEAELDGTVRNVFFFSEQPGGAWIFHGVLRKELRALIKDSTP